jgi:hypothetical protein
VSVRPSSFAQRSVCAAPPEATEPATDSLGLVTSSQHPLQKSAATQSHQQLPALSPGPAAVLTRNMALLFLRLGLIVALAGTAACRSRVVPALPPIPSNQLRAVGDFGAIPDRGDRSRALFLEASRVFLHPRCLNCHPNGDVASQGMQMTPHQPPVTRGPDSHGVVGMECTSCHQDRNLVQARVPGAPDWHLAPREMAWIGKTPRQI